MITSLFASFFGFFYIYIARQVILVRMKLKVLFGTANSDELEQIVSAHDNFSKYTVFFLLLMLILELQDIQYLFLLVFGSMFFIGRIMHYSAMKKGLSGLPMRRIGMRFTFMPILLFSVLNLFKFIEQNLKF